MRRYALATALAMATTIALAIPAAGIAATTPRTAGTPTMPGVELLRGGRQAVMPGEPQIIPDLYGGAEPRRDEPPLEPTPDAECGPGSHQDLAMQGRVVKGSNDGYTCNAELRSHEGATGGLKVERYVDAAGRQCAYYDSTLLYGTSLFPDLLSGRPTGTVVLDMTDPDHPVRTQTLTTPAMESPHESLLVNARRGLLAAAMGTVSTLPGIVDIYDISQDCRHPTLLSSSISGILGHESGFAPDGNTFYVTSLFTNTVVAVDVRDPRHPATIGLGTFPSHAMTVSDDGDRGYIAGFRGLQIVDLSQVQDRKPNPQVKEISGLSWKGMSIPQAAIPVTIDGKKMLVETDEFAYQNGFITANGDDVGAARIIDISDEHAPKVIANLRLAVNQRANRAQLGGDPGAAFIGAGYAAHYCNVPQEVDPGIVACSFITSGLRVFDIRDPYHPREIAYYVGPPKPFLGGPLPLYKANYAMSRPTFDPGHGDIWYSDINAGFRAVHLTNGVWPFQPQGATGLPGTGKCLSRRAFTIRLGSARARLRSAVVTVAGKRVRVVRRRGRLTARVDLRGRSKQTVTVKVTGRTTTGRRISETRRYRTCGASG